MDFSMKTNNSFTAATSSSRYTRHLGDEAEATIKGLHASSTREAVEVHQRHNSDIKSEITSTTLTIRPTMTIDDAKN